MTKKLFSIVVFLSFFSSISSQSFSNLVFETIIAPTETSVSITFDYSGVSSGDEFEWQLFLANPDGTPNWGSGRNIAWAGNIVPNAVGSGTQTVTTNTFNTPIDGEVFTWAGKITLGADGSDIGWNNTGNLVTISSTASLEDIKANGIAIYPNPAVSELNINANGIKPNTVAVLDIMGRKVLTFKDALGLEVLDISNLNKGIYMLLVDGKKQFKFIKR